MKRRASVRAIVSNGKRLIGMFPIERLPIRCQIHRYQSSSLVPSRLSVTASSPVFVPGFSSFRSAVLSLAFRTWKALRTSEVSFWRGARCCAWADGYDQRSSRSSCSCSSTYCPFLFVSIRERRAGAHSEAFSQYTPLQHATTDVVREDGFLQPRIQCAATPTGSQLVG